MMPAKIFHFKPKSKLIASKNLREFIKKCSSELVIYNKNTSWADNRWPGIGLFCKLNFRGRNPNLNQILDKAFIDFAKAYLSYVASHNNSRKDNTLRTLKTIEKALIQVTGEALIENISITVLDEAAMVARAHFTQTPAYNCGRGLEELAKFLNDNCLALGNFGTWRNPISRPCDSVRTGKAAKKAREEKLPNERALNAIAEIFSTNPTVARDIFTTSTFAMLMSAPSRITEVLMLPINCEVTETDIDGVERYGWRFFSVKGYEGDIKWIPSPMVSIAKEAVSRLKKLSKNAHQLALWIENHPETPFIHEDCPNVSIDTPLTKKQAATVLGLANKTNKQCVASLLGRKLSTSDYVYTLQSLWEHSIQRLPEEFPWINKKAGIKYSNTLFVYNKNQFNLQKGALHWELIRPTNNSYNNDISPRYSTSSEHKNIFDRHGYLDENNKRLQIKSHQARHLLNTIAQRGGLSNLEIAKWSGRADPKQNRVYNHTTEKEMVELAEKVNIHEGISTTLSSIRPNTPSSSFEINTLETAAVHVNEYGYCVHDYTISPCEKFRDCINCTEQVCIKGNEQNLNRVKQKLKITEQLLKKAKQDSIAGDIGADRWSQYHEKTACRLKELVTILESSDVPNGSQIKLHGQDFSQLKRVIKKKSLVTVNTSNPNNLTSTKDMRD